MAQVPKLSKPFTEEDLARALALVDGGRPLINSAVHRLRLV